MRLVLLAVFIPRRAPPALDEIPQPWSTGDMDEAGYDGPPSWIIVPHHSQSDPLADEQLRVVRAVQKKIREIDASSPRATVDEVEALIRQAVALEVAPERLASEALLRLSWLESFLSSQDSLYQSLRDNRDDIAHHD